MTVYGTNIALQSYHDRISDKMNNLKAYCYAECAYVGLPRYTWDAFEILKSV